MSDKQLLLILGLVTLLIFPLPTLLLRPWIEGIHWLELLELNNLQWKPVLLGLAYGLGYAVLASFFLTMRIFQEVPLRVEETVKALNLSIFEGIFLSICAGFGEELLFRAGLQPYLGIWLTSFIFIAIHGYISIKTPKNSLYGLLLFPFIIGISYGYEIGGLWFAVSAHFMYDAVLFTKINLSPKS
ncbi:MAG: CPBP family intramembrane glutamic endopeptidase [Bacteroidota bacterium]